MTPKTKESIVKTLQVLAPYLAGASIGAGVGGAVSDNKVSGSIKGALVGLGSVVGGKLANKAISPIFRNNDKLVSEYTSVINSGDKSKIFDFLKKNGLTGASEEELLKKFNELDKKLNIKFHTSNVSKVLAEQAGGALGLSGTAYLLRNKKQTEKTASSDDLDKVEEKLKRSPIKQALIGVGLGSVIGGLKGYQMSEILNIKKRYAIPAAALSSGLLAGGMVALGTHLGNKYLKKKIDEVREGK